jgi:2-dehydropantoate 2-reductase
MASVAPASASPRLLVVGCGGIGGIVAAHLFEQGHDVTVLTTNGLIADAVNERGFRVRGDSSPGTVRGRAVREIPQGTRPFDFVLLATQPPQVEDAARQVLHALAPTGAMVCFQNGLCEARIAAIAGPERTLGGIVAWGASMVEPGVYDRTSAGGFVLGTPDGRPDPRLDELARILEAVGPTSVTMNLAGARWSKLAINCAISSLGTIGGDRLGALMRHRHVRRLCLEIMTEVVAVAGALGVRLEKVAGTLDLDWIALTDADRASSGSPSLVAKHALLLAVGARFRRLRSSMLAAIERGRPPAIDFLNGEIVQRGAVLGVPTPMNAAIRDEVLAIAAGRARPSMDTLRAFFERTRSSPAEVTPSLFPTRSDTSPAAYAPTQAMAQVPPTAFAPTVPMQAVGTPATVTQPSAIHAPTEGLAVPEHHAPTQAIPVVPAAAYAPTQAMTMPVREEPPPPAPPPAPAPAPPRREGT